MIPYNDRTHPIRAETYTPRFDAWGVEEPQMGGFLSHNVGQFGGPICYSIHEQASVSMIRV